MDRREDEREDVGPAEEPAGEIPAELPIDGTLDLHMFAPREVKQLVPEYLDACLERGILDIRIVHGKGIGTLRSIVHGILERHPAVVWYGHQADAGAWGATVVRLRPPQEAADA